jgi:hypothetical protein
VILGCFVLFGLLGVDGALVDPQLGGRLFGAVLAVVGFAYAYVVWRAATVVLYQGGALVGTPVRPRWIPWDQMINVSLQPDRSGYGQRGHVPVIQLKSGRSVRLGFFFVPDGRSSERDIAEHVARALRAQMGAPDQV